MISENTTASASGTWLQDVQRRRKWVLRGMGGAAMLGFLMADSLWRPGRFTHEAIEYVGVGLLLVCVLGRAWCTLYIGGRKKAELVQDGPYSVSRNPLYVFSIVGAAGVGAAAGSVVTTILLAVACYAVFASVVGREERFLAERFGRSYAEYCARVPRFWPRLSVWRDVPTVEASPRLVLASVRDGALFFLAIPIVESIEHLHTAGILPVYLLLP